MACVISKLETTDKFICNFYSNNPSINFEQINLQVCKLLESCKRSDNNEFHKKFNISNIFDDTNTNFEKNKIKSCFCELDESKKQYNDYFSEIINNKNNTINKILIQLENNINEHIHKIITSITNLLINNHIIHNKIFDMITHFKNTILKNLNDKISNDQIFIEYYTVKYDNMIQDMQLYFMSEDPNKNKIINNQNFNCDGELGEKKLEIILNNILPNAEIINSGHLQNKGDFLIKREENIPPIIILSKIFDKNICEDEINNFILIIKENNCNGIFMSQNSGIVNKKNHQIEFINGKVVIFLHNVNYCPDKIQNTIESIDTLFLKIKSINLNIQESIDKEIINEINKEYQDFMNKKEFIIHSVKENQKILINEISGLQFINLDKFLSTKFTASKKKGTIECNICKKYTSNTLKGMAAHKRGCKKKHIQVT